MPHPRVARRFVTDGAAYATCRAGEGVLPGLGVRRDPGPRLIGRTERLDAVSGRGADASGRTTGIHPLSLRLGGKVDLVERVRGVGDRFRPYRTA